MIIPCLRENFSNTFIKKSTISDLSLSQIRYQILLVTFKLFLIIKIIILIIKNSQYRITLKKKTLPSSSYPFLRDNSFHKNTLLAQLFL